MRRQDIHFVSGGERCSAWLFRPQASKCSPCVVMGSGLSCVRDQGLDPVPSQANFLLVGVQADDLAVAKALLRRGLLVRPGQDFGMPGYLRITIGPLPLMERLAEELARARDELEAAEAVG